MDPPDLSTSHKTQGPSSVRYNVLEHLGRSAPSNVVKCLELDRLCQRRPLLYREQYLANGLASVSCMHVTDIVGHHGCVNAVSFSNDREEHLVTGQRNYNHKMKDFCIISTLVPMC